MAQIPSYDQWIKDTYSLTSPRSEFLKKVDEALQTYNRVKSAASRDALRTALDRWRFEQSKQGKDWRKSVRNEKGAVTNLHRALTELDKRQLTPAEREAIRFISRSQAMALQRMFDGKTLQFKPTTLMGAASSAASKWAAFKTGASSVAAGGAKAGMIAHRASDVNKGVGTLANGGRAGALSASQVQTSSALSTINSKVREFCRELCPGLDPDTVFQALRLGSVEHFAVTLSPFIGAISSGGKALVGWIGVAKKMWDASSIAEARAAFAPRDPEAAFDAVLELIDREIQSAVGSATISSVGFTGKALGLFADGGAVTGPVVGLLEILAQIFQAIVEYARDYKECRAGADLLSVGALNFDLFKVSPILGCYFLVVQDHSTIINFAVADYGTDNWMMDVERLVVRIAPVLDKARILINVSRLEVPGMANYKGLVAANYSVKTGLDAVVAAPGALKDKISTTVEGWFDNPVRPPAVDKSRIIGFGSNVVAARP